MPDNYCFECGAPRKGINQNQVDNLPDQTIVACDEGGPLVSWITWTSGKENRIEIEFHVFGGRDRKLILTTEHARSLQDQLIGSLIDEKTSSVHDSKRRLGGDTIGKS